VVELTNCWPKWEGEWTVKAIKGPTSSAIVNVKNEKNAY